MGLLMQGFFIISCEIPVFPADNVPMSAGKITAWFSGGAGIYWLVSVYRWGVHLRDIPLF